MIVISYTHNGVMVKRDFAGPYVVIGRRKAGVALDLDLDFDGGVSRPHARIGFEGDQLWIEDLDSKLGTYVNDCRLEKLERRPLQPDDTLKISDTTLYATLHAATANASSLNHQVSSAPLQQPTLLTASSVASSSDHVKAGFATNANGSEIVVTEVIAASVIKENLESLQRIPADSSDARSAVMTQRLSLLYELPLCFGAEKDLEALLQLIVDKLVEVIPGAARGAVLLCESDNLVLKAYASPGEPSVSETLARQAMLEEKGLIWRCDDELSSDSIMRCHMHAGMYAPLLWQGEALGVVCVDNPCHDSAFTEDDLRLILAVAHYAAMAVAHHCALQTLRRYAEFNKRLFANRYPPRVRARLAQEIENGTFTLGARSSHVTVLLADIRGSTALASRIGAHRMSELLNEYFPALVQAIHAHDGTLSQLIGDSIMAAFGTPEPDLRQHEQAVRAALAMQEAASAISAARLARGVEACSFGIGVHCGEALHGFIGNTSGMEFVVIGDPANFGSRYCNGAESGEVIISPAVYQRVYKHFQVGKVGISTKHEGEITAYKVQAAK